MKKEKRNKYFGETISERVSEVINELDIDAVGLWQIVGVGMDGFELTGIELEDYVRRNIIALLEAGAHPIKGSKSGKDGWQVQHQYGTTIDEITEAIIKDWKSWGRDPDVSEVWFGLPEFYKK